MKDLTLEEFETMLCSTGYLPPRTENELIFFNQMYEGYQSRMADRHVDVDAIVSGACRVVSIREYDIDIDEESYTMIAEGFDDSYSMAARNYDKLPKEILDKMRKQHRSKKDDEN